MMDQGSEPGVQPPRSRWRMAFFTLLAVNLAALGLVAGAVFRDGGPRERMIKELGFGPFTEAFSDEDRAALRRGFLMKLPDFRADRMAMQKDALALVTALRADTYDPAALRGALDQVQGRMQARVAVGRDLLLERIDAMDPAARQAFADRLEEGLRHGPGKKGD